MHELVPNTTPRSEPVLLTSLAPSGRLFTVTAVNMSAGVAKDAAFAKMFGAGGAKPPPVPLASFGLFAGRDLLTIGAGFILPKLVASTL